MNYETDLNKNPANYAPLSPIGFLQRAAAVYPGRISLIHGDQTYNWSQTYQRSRQLASALQQCGVRRGDTVSVMASNIPALYEAHFGVPMAGAVLNALNIRLDPDTIAFILNHAETKILLTDREFASTVEAALEILDREIVIVDISDDAVQQGKCLGDTDYEQFISHGDGEFEAQLPQSEWDAISLNYTSGTTGNPKGVVYHYRGAYLNSLSNAIDWSMSNHPVYLWTLPMFHCNGWCFPWTIAMLGGTNVCLRKVTAPNIFNAIAEHHVTHFCGAPIVLGMVVNASDDERRDFQHTVNVMTAAAPPPATVLASMERNGFRMTHVYGLTETYGPAVVCAWHEAWNELEESEQAALKARQGVPYTVLDDLQVIEPKTMSKTSPDGSTLGEVMFRGNNVMKGYLKNKVATEQAFADGWFHSGDLGVMHSDGYIQLKDRSKDIIISGGENISSIEVEDALYKHPAVLEAAVVAKSDETWGETPCAFITLKPDYSPAPSSDDIIQHCKENLARYKAPTCVVFGSLPKTSTGKIQKFLLRQQAESQ